MKKSIWIIILIIITFSACSVKKDETPIVTSNNMSRSTKVIINKEELNIENILPKGISMKSSYEDIVKLYGKPKNTTNFNDETLITQKGYFTDLGYNNIDFIIYCYDKEKPFNLQKDNEVFQIDFYGEGSSLNNLIKIGDSYDIISSKYKTDELTSVNIQDIKEMLNRFRKDNTYLKYNKILSITSKNMNTAPVSMIMLFDDNNVLERICYIKPNAD